MHRPAASSLVFSSLFFSLLLGAGLASADEGAAYRPHSGTPDAVDRDARKACLSGDYQTGVDILSDLFLDTKDPAHIFNQGRCYEGNERYAEAIGRFREYLRMGGQDTALAQKHIAECEALAHRAAPLASAVVSPRPTPVASTVEAPVAAARASPIAEAKQVPRSSNAKPGSGLRTTGLVVAGAGAAAVIAGVVFNLKANSLGRSISPPNLYHRSTESERKDYATLAWTGYAVGAVGLAAGAALYGLGFRQGRNDQARTTVIPTLGRGLAGASIASPF